MLHSLESLESCTYNGTDVTVLQRQAARLKWQLQQNYVVQDNSSVPQFQGLIGSNLGTGQMVELKRPDIYLGSDDFQEFVNFPVAGPEFGDSEKLDLVPPEASAAAATDYCISRTSSCQLTALHSAVMKEETEDMILEKMESTTGSGRGSFNKRKAEAVADHKNKDKRIKGEVEGESEVKTKCSTEISGISSKGNSKASEVQKPDYIHVRARRGQATDSHSLAERARREKISKKMKCLQDLVPGCDKITGKAGMLDEIINYVQSLQRQVEFLSMKIAALHPNVKFNVENIPMKEFPALVANFPAAAKVPEMACFQLNQLQKEAVNCMFNETMHHPQTASEGIANASISISEQALSSSSMTQLQPFSTWNTDPQCLYNAYNMGFH